MAEETMKDYETELERSFQILHEGDLIETTVIGVSDTEITVDLNYYTEGIIPLEECSDDPAFSIKSDVSIGETIQAMVIDPEDARGSVLLSCVIGMITTFGEELLAPLLDMTIQGRFFCISLPTPTPKSHSYTYPRLQPRFWAFATVVLR